MKFLVDAQLPPAMGRWLRDRGHLADHVADIGMLAASDDRIARHATENDAVLVTKDDDFIWLRLPDRYALVWIRLGNATNRALFAWLEPRWPVVERMLTSGERFIEVR